MRFTDIEFTHDLEVAGLYLGSVDVTAGIVSGGGTWHIHTLYKQERTTRLGVTISHLVELPKADPLVALLREQLNASTEFRDAVNKALESERQGEAA